MVIFRRCLFQCAPIPARRSVGIWKPWPHATLHTYTHAYRKTQMSRCTLCIAQAHSCHNIYNNNQKKFYYTSKTPKCKWQVQMYVFVFEHKSMRNWTAAAAATATNPKIADSSRCGHFDLLRRAASMSKRSQQPTSIRNPSDRYWSLPLTHFLSTFFSTFLNHHLSLLARLWLAAIDATRRYAQATYEVCGKQQHIRQVLRRCRCIGVMIG